MPQAIFEGSSLENVHLEFLVVYAGKGHSTFFLGKV